MNVATHQEKEKNEKTVKRKAGVKRRQADFKEAACYSSAVVQGMHVEKIVCVSGVPGVTGTLRKANNHFDLTQTGRGPHHHVEAAVDWHSSIFLALHLHTTYTAEISHFTIQNIRVNTCFEDGQKVRNDD